MLELFGLGRRFPVALQHDRIFRRSPRFSGGQAGANVLAVSTSSSTAILLVRHGQSLWNAEGRWQGQADPALSECGREQAHAAGLRLGQVDVIASSPQLRALETAMIISEQIGIGPVISVPDLRERSAGLWSGLTRVDIETGDPGAIEAGRWPEGWEPDDEVFARADGALRSLVAEFPRGTILAIGHGGVIRTIEIALGAEQGRVPNLSGRLLTMHDRDGSHLGTGDWILGATMALIDPELSTGGDGVRV